MPATATKPKAKTTRRRPSNSKEPKRKTYQTIVIDPPWPGPGSVPAFDHRKELAVIPYNTMTGIQCAALNVAELAADDGQLFLWTTSRNIGDAFLLLQTWGFKYRGLFIWKKPLGLGKNVRSEAEFLVWGARRGAPAPEMPAPRQIHEWKDAGRRRRHSEKPAAAYKFIQSISEGPRLDIFARQTRPGFEAWGNQRKRLDDANAAA